MSLCVIDYLAFFRQRYVGKNKIGKNYKGLVRDYLCPINAGYIPGEIYWLRCALVHTYAMASAHKGLVVTSYLLTHCNPSLHLSKTNPKLLSLNVDTFVADVVLAACSFFDKESSNPEVTKKGSTLLKCMA